MLEQTFRFYNYTQNFLSKSEENAALSQIRTQQAELEAQLQQHQLQQHQ